VTEVTATEVEAWGDDGGPLAVVALHGRGQPPEFIRGLAERIALPGIRWFAPSAEGRSWYPLPFLDPSPENAVHLARALDAVQQAVTAAWQQGFARVAVLGFSQGACVLAHLLLAQDVAVTAAVLFTGGYVGPQTMDARDVVARAGTPVLLRSVSHDPWVPAHRVADTARLLIGAGAQVDALIEPGDEHIVTERAVEDARRLLAGLLTTKGADS
jgi:predicted esterase